MKNQFLLILTLCVMGLGCSKNDPNYAKVQDKENLEINSDLKVKAFEENRNILGTINLENEPSRRLSFSKFLSDAEKVNLLRIRFENLIAEMNMNLNQISLVKEVNEFLVEDLFKDSELRKRFIQFEVGFKERALASFTEKELIFVFASLKTYSEYKNDVKSQSLKVSASSGSEGGEDKKTCACNQSSDWCGERDGPCVSADCKSTPSTGCGFLLAHPCNGWCKLLLPLL